MWIEGQAASGVITVEWLRVLPRQVCLATVAGMPGSIGSTPNKRPSEP